VGVASALRGKGEVGWGMDAAVLSGTVRVFCSVGAVVGEWVDVCATVQR
jgi:hypothetical protein